MNDPKYIDMQVFYHAVAYCAVAMVWSVPIVLVVGVAGPGCGWRRVDRGFPG